MKRILFFTLITAIVLASCKPKVTPPNVVTTATLKGPSAMAMIRMIEDRPSPDSGFTTKFSIRNEPGQVRSMIIEGSVDFAVLPSTMGALLYNKTHQYLLAAIPVWGTLYLFGSDTTIHCWADLKGKRIYLMARGMTPDIMFRFLARENGLNPDRDMVLDYSFPTHIELANAVAAGMADLGVISEPLVSLVMKKNPSVHPIIDFNEEWIRLFGSSVPFAQTALLVKKDFAAAHAGVVSGYLDELQQSIRWVNANPGQAAELIVKHGILPDSTVAARAIPGCNLRYSAAWEDRKGIGEYFKVFYNFSPLILGGVMPDEAFYYKKPDH